MIQKIQKNEYLQRYDNMNAQERKAYESRVGKWIVRGQRLFSVKCALFETSLQNILQVSTTWNDNECQTFEEGARLLSAMASTHDTWLPEMLYVKSAKRAIKNMLDILSGVVPNEDKQEETRQGTKETETKQEPEQAPFQDNASNGRVTDGSQNSEVQVDAVPARPKHIDQYVHLLPQKTQEHAALVQGLYRELKEARRKMALLVDDKTASPADREAWAKKAVKCDNTLRKIFDELDAEWAKLAKSGRVMVDDLGNARVMPEANEQPAQEPEQAEQGSPEQDGQNTDEQKPTELTPEQKARRRDLRKWLVDTRRGNGDTREDYVKKWETNFREYLTVEPAEAAFKDEKILEAMKHYGINIEQFQK